jgi:hypothetical protein
MVRRCKILDVSNPASPVELGKSQTPATDVEVVGTLGLRAKLLL